MFRIRFEVPPVPYRGLISPKVWATLSLWDDGCNVEFETVVIKVCDVESLAKGGGYPKITQKFCVELNLNGHKDGVKEAQESAEKLAEMLGLEFGLDKAPVVGFEADKS